MASPRSGTPSAGSASATPAAKAKPDAEWPDGNDVDVDRRCRAPIEPQLVLAGAPPLLERAEVEETEVERLLELPRMVAGEHHDGDVSFDTLHGVDAGI